MSTLDKNSNQQIQLLYKSKCIEEGFIVAEEHDPHTISTHKSSDKMSMSDLMEKEKDFAALYAFHSSKKLGVLQADKLNLEPQGNAPSLKGSKSPKNGRK